MMRSLFVFALLLFAVPAAAAPKTASQECMEYAEELDKTHAEADAFKAKYKDAGRETLEAIDKSFYAMLGLYRDQYEACLLRYTCPEASRVLKSDSAPPEVKSSFVNMLDFALKTCNR